MKKLLITACALQAMIACNTQPEAPSQEVVVTADRQTEPAIAVAGDDAADDPAIWYNEADPNASLIFGTNKDLGLEVYTLKGNRVADYRTGLLNNVDVRRNFKMGDSLIDIVAASNRTHNRIDVWAIDPTGTDLKFISNEDHRSQLEEVYGFCLYQNPADSSVYAMVNGKSGVVEQWNVVATANGVELEFMRTYQANGQVEGMVTDEQRGLLFVGEEDGGIFVYKIDSEEPRMRIEWSGEENPDLKYDIEGLALYQGQNGNSYLIASSQGNFRYAVFEGAGDYGYLGYFAIGDGEYTDGVEETDGLDIFSTSLGDDFPNGMFIVQDGFNKENGEAVPQNFKMVRWEKVQTVIDEMNSTESAQ